MNDFGLLDDRDRDIIPFEVDERFSSTNTDFGGDDPAALPSGETATYDPEAVYRGEEL